MSRDELAEAVVEAAVDFCEVFPAGTVTVTNANWKRGFVHHHKLLRDAVAALREHDRAQDRSPS